MSDLTITITPGPSVSLAVSNGQPRTITVYGGRGHPGADGRGVGSRRFAYDAGPPIYCYVGVAPELGAADGDTVWDITRLTLSTAGTVTATGTASDVTWTGRAGHTYT